jgi:hypothetical protein
MPEKMQLDRERLRRGVTAAIRDGSGESGESVAGGVFADENRILQAHAPAKRRLDVQQAWFIHPASPIRRKRNGSRAVGM